jgi:hypothetical protein
MRLRTPLSSLLLIAFAACCITASAERAMAQSETAKPQPPDEVNLDTQLFLIVGSNQEAETGRIPAQLDPVIKQLRNTLPFKNYRLAATLINRVKNEGRLNLRWVGGPMTAFSPSPSTPSFSEFKVSAVRLIRDSTGQQMVRMDDFSFGARIPIQTSSTVASNAPALPVFNYESTGLNTQISMREGEPVVVGTLNIGPSGDAIILVVSAKRTGQ